MPNVRYRIKIRIAYSRELRAAMAKAEGGEGCQPITVLCHGSGSPHRRAPWHPGRRWRAPAPRHGLLLIAGTLHYTRKAVVSADGMLSEAKLTTEAAVRSANTSERALKGLERPYMFLRVEDSFIENLRPTPLRAASA